MFSLAPFAKIHRKRSCGPAKRVHGRLPREGTYDTRTDSLTVVFKEGGTVAESDEVRRGIVLDYDTRGDLVSLKILDASKRVTDAQRMQFETSS